MLNRHKTQAKGTTEGNEEHSSNTHADPAMSEGRLGGC